MNSTVEAKYFWCNVWAILFCVFFLNTNAKAQDYNVRQTLSVLPSELYPKMISMIPAGEWVKVNECFQSLQPLFSSIDQKFSTVYSIQLGNSIKSENKEDALHFLTQAAVYGIIDHLHDAINLENRSKIEAMTRVSFAEFISIEKQFKVQHFNRCQQIVLLFRKSYSYSTDAEKFENNTNELIVKLKYLAENAG